MNISAQSFYEEIEPKVTEEIREYYKKAPFRWKAISIIIIAIACMLLLIISHLLNQKALQYIIVAVIILQFFSIRARKHVSSQYDNQELAFRRAIQPTLRNQLKDNNLDSIICIEYLSSFLNVQSENSGLAFEEVFPVKDFSFTVVVPLLLTFLQEHMKTADILVIASYAVSVYTLVICSLKLRKLFKGEDKKLIQKNIVKNLCYRKLELQMEQNKGESSVARDGRPDRKGNGHQTDSKKKKLKAMLTFFKKHAWKCLVIVITIALVLFFALTLRADAFRGTKLVAENADAYGSFVGGVLGTVLSFLSILLVIYTISEQKKSQLRNSIETRVLTMIQLHRDNVSELTYEAKDKDSNNPTLRGRNVMKELFEEYKLYYLMCLDNYFAKNDDQMDSLAAAAYCALYYGKGSELDKRLIELGLACKSNDLFSPTTAKTKYNNHDGCQIYLGHYYRHLFQTVKYIDKQTLLTQEEKYGYVKMLRAQLSTEEQALLFLNSLSPLSAAWKVHPKDKHEKGTASYMIAYKMIKNIPENFISIEKHQSDTYKISPKEHYPEIFFEYEEFFDDYGN